MFLFAACLVGWSVVVAGLRSICNSCCYCCLRVCLIDCLDADDDDDDNSVDGDVVVVNDEFVFADDVVAVVFLFV